MALRKAQPITWTPTGCVDAVDGSTAPRGGMSSLSNLVPDPSTSGIFVPRPAAINKTYFSTSGIATPGFISAMIVVGDRVYGMISTSSPSGKDVPFVYDLAAGTFVTVTGMLSGNTPTSPATSGAWTPPTMAVIGTKVMVTHPGFSGSNKIGWIDISTPASPTWSAGNTTTTLLPSVPVAVFNFNDRAWYAVGNTLYYSDVLVPTTITSSTQSVTCGDSSDIKALGGMPITTTQGGVLQSMMVFKSKAIFQITGDAALFTLLNNAIAAGIGTDAPLSLAPSPLGLFFISQHGLRLISLDGQISEPIGAEGQGISVPFINAYVPSRICAAFNVNTVRITVQNQNIPTLPVQEWWFNTDLKSWTGSHTFPASLIAAWGGTFIMTPNGINNSLWQSDIVPLSTSSYIENGNQLTFGYAPALLPLTGGMNMNAVIETSIGVEYSQTGGTLNFSAVDENGNLLDLVTKSVTVSAAVWGTSTWGSGNWGGSVQDYQQMRISWSKPLVFNQMIVGVNGNAVTGFRIGTMCFRYQQLGYMLPP